MPAVAPPAALVEQPLQGAPARLPEVWLVPSRQTKEELAAYLMTDLAQLNWVNPGLPDEVPPGTLVVVPPGSLAHVGAGAARNSLAVGSNSRGDVGSSSLTRANR